MAASYRRRKCQTRIGKQTLVLSFYRHTILLLLYTIQIKPIEQRRRRNESENRSKYESYTQARSHVARTMCAIRQIRFRAKSCTLIVSSYSGSWRNLIVSVRASCGRLRCVVSLRATSDGQSIQSVTCMLVFYPHLEHSFAVRLFHCGMYAGFLAQHSLQRLQRDDVVHECITWSVTDEIGIDTTSAMQYSWILQGTSEEQH